MSQTSATVVPAPLSMQASGKYDNYAETGPGTLAGRLMRRFWHPVYLSANLAPGRAYPVTVMSEAYTVYRGHSGQAYVVGGRCAHRSAMLHTGWIEGDEIRCFYHGWKYNGAGRCTEIPGDTGPAHTRVSIPGLPTEEYMGMIFAYFGDDTPPPMPRYPEFEGDGVIDAVRRTRLCNYFQSVENNVDPAHTPYTHGVSEYARAGLVSVPEVIGEETEWGIAQYSKRPEGTRVSHYAMPNIIFIKFQPEGDDDGWKDYMVWRVPMDDHSHINYLVSYANVKGAAAERVRQRIARREVRLRQFPPGVEIARSVLRGETQLSDHTTHPDLFYIQDDVAQMSQGVIADRSKERLGRSDRLIVLLRRIWSREMKALAEGKPMKDWYRPAGMSSTTGIENAKRN